jgi:predicted dehydrogenase
MSHQPADTTDIAINRRTFVRAAGAAGAGLALGGCTARGTAAASEPAATAPATRPSMGRYAIVGLGVRSSMYQDAIERGYKQHATLVGLCDTNPGRLELARSRSKKNSAQPPPAFGPDDFEKMIRSGKADTVVVTTVDSTHNEYIVRAMNAGCDVITEKPMTTTAEKCQQILDARRKTGRRCRVTFNYRYSPQRTQIKDILMSGEIGDVLSVDFHWLLNTHHGADYFRRWHRQKKFSGGLMIHKATHHFDLANWWLGAMPARVYATGKREFYTPAMAKRFGLQGAHQRCLTCPEKDRCSFHIDLAANPTLKALYLDNEKYDGYHRDQCVWQPSDIEDTMNVLVKYDNGVTMAYSLNAFNAWEGYTIAFNGTKGRLEHSDVEQLAGGAQDGSGPRLRKGVSTVVIPLRGAPREIEPWTGEGGHGGGDKLLLDDLLLPSPPADKYLRAADERAGAASILIGVAANQCFRTGEPVKISKLVDGLKNPDYPPMPLRTDSLPMPR